MQQTEWSRSTFGIAASGVGGLILAVGAVTLITDLPGRVLVGVAAIGLVAFAMLSWRARPKLAIKNDALVSRGLLGETELRLADIKLIRITEFRRIGR